MAAAASPPALCTGAWLILAAVLAVVAITVKQPTNDSLAIPGTQSQQALNLLDQKFPGTSGAQAQVVFSVSAPKSPTDPAEHQAVEATLAQLRKLPQVVDVTDPYQTRGGARRPRRDQLARRTRPG